VAPFLGQRCNLTPITQPTNRQSCWRARPRWERKEADSVSSKNEQEPLVRLYSAMLGASVSVSVSLSLIYLLTSLCVPII